MESDTAHLRQYARTGDADAFAWLVSAHAGMVFATARRITGDTHLAEDATQSAFLALARDAGHVRTNVVGWLHRTATHRALDAVRSRRRADRRDRAAACDEATIDPTTNPRVDSEWAELLPVIDRAIADLPADLRLPLVLHFLQGRSQADVAAELGVDASTVSRRIDRAVASLRATLRRQGFSAPAALPAALGQCGPQALPATLHSALVKIGLSGVGVERTAWLGMQWAAMVAGCVALVGLIVWSMIPPANASKVAVAPPAMTPPATAPTSAPTTRPIPPPPAIDLIRAVVQAESWIDTAKSLSIEADAVWHTNAQAIASRAAALKKQFPDLPITPEKFPELRPGDGQTRRHIAFDDRRVRRLSTNLTRGETDLAIWDGAKGYGRSTYTTPRQDNIGIRPTVGDSFSSLFGYLDWPARWHHLWFDPLEGNAEEQESSRKIIKLWESLWPEAAVRGPVLSRGTWCWVVIFRKQSFERWYVGVDDHRLYGSIRGVTINDDAVVTGAYVRAAAARGKTVASTKEFWAWEDQWEASFAPGPRQVEFERLMGDVNINLGVADAPPPDEKWCADYREVAPGCWLPFKQGWTEYKTENGATFKEYEQELAVTKVIIDQPLPDAWFKFSFDDAEGVQVFDRTFSPPLIYKWKKDRTPAEWQAVFDEAQKRQADEDARQAALNKLVGQPAPAFGNGEWLNGPPRTWADFKGKVVVASFWAEWCGPCKNDLPALVRLAGDPAAGIAVVGIHTAGSRRRKIDAHLRQFDITYPVYVDTDDGGGFGTVMAAFGVHALPQAFVIDSGGRVAAQGPLGEILPLARTLARQAATRPTTSP